MPSVYKDKKSKYYQTDIWIDGCKFHRSTKKTSEREALKAAEQIERDLTGEIAAQGPEKFSLKLDTVAERYMRDIGDQQAGEGPAITQSKISLVLKFFMDKYGDNVALSDIDHDKATQLLNWRRKHKLDTARALLDLTGSYKAKSAKTIGPYTVNDTLEQLKKLFTYAKARKAHLPDAPTFKLLYLPLDEVRPRFLSGTESDRLDAATLTARADYDPLIQFARVTGKRKSECLLRWPMVKWERGLIELRGKRNKKIRIVITPTIRAILWPLREHHPEFVFTYVAQTTQRRKQPDGSFLKWVKGKRYPITKYSLRTAWVKIRKAAGIPITGDDRFRWHDIRHDFATNLLASIPTADGMKVVQEALGHAKITTTMGTYAHVSPDRIADAIEAQAAERLQRRNQNHPENHPTLLRNIK